MAPTGDFQLSYRSRPEDLEGTYAEFLDVAGLAEEDVLRLSRR